MVLNEIVQFMMGGLECTALDSEKVPFHFVLFSYVVDISECENMLAV